LILNKVISILKVFNIIWLVNKSLLILSIFIRIILGFIPYVNLIIFEKLVNSVVLFVESNINYESIFLILLIQLLLMVFNSIMSNLMELIDNKLEYNLDYYLQKKTGKKAATVPLAYFDDNQFYNHQSRVSGGLGNRMLVPIKNLLNILQRLITLISYMIILMNVHWILAILSTLTFLPVIIVNRYYGKKNFSLLISQTPKAREANYYRSLLIDRASAKEVRLFNLKHYLLQKWEILYLDNLKEILNLFKRQSYAKMGLDMATGILFGITSAILIRIIKSGNLTIGMFVVIIQAIQGMQSTINSISFLLANIYKENLFIQDLFNFLNYEDKTINIYKNNYSFPLLKEGIVFDNVSFNYPRSTKEVLKEISFTVIPGEKIAIVGSNGSGKTTLVKCLMGLYPISKGNIFFDKISIKEINPHSLWENITVIFQDYVKYHFSVKENIAIGKIEKINDYHRYKEVTDKTDLDILVSSFKNGYDTILSKVYADGEELSGGQWQKIAIARGLFRSGQVFILDEPTASLDPYTELEVFEQFQKISEEQTTFFISHRMAAAKMADRILVLKEGQLIEEGNHEQLMELNGEYTKMYNMQAKWYH